MSGVEKSVKFTNTALNNTYLYTAVFSSAVAMQRPFALLWQKQRPIGLSLSHVSTKRERVCV